MNCVPLCQSGGLIFFEFRGFSLFRDISSIVVTWNYHVTLTIPFIYIYHERYSVLLNLNCMTFFFFLYIQLLLAFVVSTKDFFLGGEWPTRSLMVKTDVYILFFGYYMFFEMKRFLSFNLFCFVKAEQP